jgi:hypothetical protein
MVKEKLLRSGIGTLLQHDNISCAIPRLRTISCTHQSNKYIPVANVYMLRCGLQIGGGKCWQVSLYRQSDGFLSDFHCVWVS